jgi:uncharacterized membrane protein
MISWESSTFSARPAEEVFAYVADVRNDPNWHKDVNSATVIKETANSVRAPSRT